MNCPHCSAQWKIPFKNRGELYECWNCHEKVQIPEAPQFIITSVATMEQVEQGGEGYQFTLCLSNPGTMVTLDSIKFTFLNNQQDVSHHYRVIPAETNATELDYHTQVELHYVIDLSHEVPVGSTKIFIEILGQDVLEESSVMTEAELSWDVVFQRIFYVQTEHDYVEIAGNPFCIHLQACFLDNSQDTSYNGTHVVRFIGVSSQNENEQIMSLEMPVEFVEGIGTTPPEFIFYNASEKIQFHVLKNAIGGPQGQSDWIKIVPNELETFDIQFTSPQINNNPFLGVNTIQALDKYGNVLPDFCQDVTIKPHSKKGELCIHGIPNNIIPGKIFQNGMADLTSLQLIYNSIEENITEFFIFSYKDKTQQSEPIFIQENPIKVQLKSIDSPSIEELGKMIYFNIVLFNPTNQDLYIDLEQMEFQVLCEGVQMEDFFHITPQGSNAFTLLPQSEETISFDIQIDSSMPSGYNQISFLLHIVSKSSGMIGYVSGSHNIELIPVGRYFDVISPDNLIVTAGNIFSMQLATYIEDKLDPTYHGIKKLICQYRASASPSNIFPQIPEEIDVQFIQGIGDLPQIFAFTNASELPELQIIDPTPGGPVTEILEFQVKPSDLDSFILEMQAELVNTTTLKKENRIIAIDTYGNVVTNFAEPCKLAVIKKQGKLCCYDKEIDMIPPDAFCNGIVSLHELHISYHSNLPSTLPYEEEFFVYYKDKGGKSRSVTIAPRPAQIVILRCSHPQDLEQGGDEYPIYLELENQGDSIAEISSVLFSFQKEQDVSSHYTILRSPNNSKQLIAGVPLQLAYTVKISNKVPTGLTDVEIKVTGRDSITNLPWQAQTSFQWNIEARGRAFVVETEHQNIETAGVPFSMKIMAILETQQKDTSFSGKHILEISSTASESPNNVSPTIPAKVTLNFEKGEAKTAPVFTLVHANEKPHITFRLQNSTVQGTSKAIHVQSGALSNFIFEIGSSFIHQEPIIGKNILKCLDAYGNSKKDFQEPIEITIQDLAAELIDNNGNAIHTLPAREFQEGIFDLTKLNAKIVCQKIQKLPSWGHFCLTYQEHQFISPEFEIEPSLVAIFLEKIESPNKIIPEQKNAINILLNNKSNEEVKIQSIQFKLTQGDNIYLDYTFEEDANNKKILSQGYATLLYWLKISSNIPIGKYTGKIKVEIPSAVQEIQEKSFTFEVEPSGRSFIIATEHENIEMVGNPFGLKLTTILQDHIDPTFNGEYEIHFQSKATASPNKKIPKIPNFFKLQFIKGEAKTPTEFILYNANETPCIQAQEKITGGASGISAPITLKPSKFQGFRWQLSSPQTNAIPFQDTNTLTALDIFGNIKTDFQDDVRLHTDTKKANVHLTGTSINNVISRKCFLDGQVNLTLLKIKLMYPSTMIDTLPTSDRIVATYENKESISNDIIVKPRPGNIQVSNIEFPKTPFQDTKKALLSIQCKNQGDALVEFHQFHYNFLTQDNQNLDDYFEFIPNPNNQDFIEPEMQTTIEYWINIHDDTPVTDITLYITLEGLDINSKQMLKAVSQYPFQILEKPRELSIQTEHKNTESAGQSFFLKLTALKNGEKDIDYHGPREIQFKVQSDVPVKFPKEPQIIEFHEGYAETQRDFRIDYAGKRITFTAQEIDKSFGTIEDIIVQPGELRSIKIEFPQDGKVHHRLHLLDAYNNEIKHNFSIDDDVHQGTILTGSNGTLYEVQSVVGHGAMGKVYKAKRLNDNQIVAIKVALFNALSDMSRFLLEGITLIRFQHENIVKGYDLRQICIKDKGRDQIRLFMVMEFLTGQSAKDILDASKTGTMSLLQSTEIILHIARALTYMWENNTLHRDIKPENIQITADNKIKLMDLGIAKTEAEEFDVYLTQKETIVGSYPYIPPERLKGDNADYRSDIYSLGATYYHLLTGMPPYLDTYNGSGGRDLLDYLIKVRMKKMPTPINKLVDIPDDVNNIIMQMLQLKINKRCNTPQEFLENLENLYKSFL